MMKVLFIVPYVPNLIRVRPFNLIRHLSQRGHSVTVMTLWSNEAERQSAAELAQVCDRVVAMRLPKWRSLLNVAAAAFGQTPLQAVFCWQPALARQINTAIWPDDRSNKPNFDVIHIEHLRGACYGLDLRSQNRSISRATLPIVWDSVDSITHLFRQSSANSAKMFNRLLTGFELRRTTKHEAMLVRSFDRTLVTSAKDRDTFLEVTAPDSPERVIKVLPNGVDLIYFTPDFNMPREKNTLVISGKMSYHANVSMVLYFVQQVLPIIRASHPDVKVVIAGKDPPSDILSLSQQPNITVTGTVTDIRPYLRQATIAVAPLTYGAGIQNKVLEAMACGTPVVATDLAISALPVTPGKDLLAAENAEDFARKVSSLLDDVDLRSAISTAGRAYVERNHDWQTIAACLEETYTEVIREGISNMKGLQIW